MRGFRWSMVMMLGLCLSAPALLHADSTSATQFVQKGVEALELGDPEAMHQARNYYEQALQADRTHYEAAWRLSEVSYYLWEAAEGWEEGEGSKRQALLEHSRIGVQAGRLAQRIEPDGVEGIFWLAANLGIWGLSNGVLDSLAQVPEILRLSERCMEVDPEGRFERGSCYRIAGALHTRLPGFPISVGDREKALEFLQQSLVHGGDYGINRNLLAELHLARRQVEQAIRELEDNLAMMESRKPHDYFDRRDTARAKSLLEKAQSRL